MPGAIARNTSCAGGVNLGLRKTAADVVLPVRCLRERAKTDIRLAAITFLVLEAMPAKIRALRVTRIWSSEEEERVIEERVRRITGNPKYHTTHIHCQPPPYRALDLSIRCVYSGERLDDREIQRLADHVNLEWAYDPARPGIFCAVARPHGTGPHLHLQVHPATRRRDEL